MAKKQKTMKKYLYVLLLLGIAALAVGYKVYNKPHQNIAASKADITMNAQDLFGAFADDETTANEKYLDKLIAVSGIVKEVNVEEEGMTSVTLETTDETFGIICQMDNLTKHKRTNFQIGEKVKFKGLCTGMLMDVVLVRCVEI